MNKLQGYFDYYKNNKLFHKGWYENLKKWVGFVQVIKQELKDKDFDENTVNTLLAEKSNNEIKDINGFFEGFLFEQHNFLGNIGQGVIWDSNDNPHKTEIKNKIGFDFFVGLLKGDNSEIAEASINECLKVQSDKNYNAAKFRLLRALFPEQLSATDAPNKLDSRIKLINDKLGIKIEGNNVLEWHKNLMQNIKSDDIYLKQMFFWDIKNMLDNNLNLKKAIIYYGAPGTGKTYKAKQVAKRFIDEHRLKSGNPNGIYSIETVQFHPSYSYEDFIEGIRPSAEKELKLFNGTFKQFCKKSAKIEAELYKSKGFLEKYKDINFDFSLIKVNELTPEQKGILGIEGNNFAEEITISEVIEPAFFIIDEINRAELSRVFGELMYSLEYRGYNGMIKTQYAYLNKDENAENIYFWENGEDWFFIPQNVFIIGTMNNIDRSVDSFDFALRRRFSWEEVNPDFKIVRELLTKDWKDSLAEAFEKLNNQIENDELLGKDYRLGHAYGLQIKPIEGDFESATEAKTFLWSEFMKPLLEEYLRGMGDAKKANEKIANFQKTFGVS